MCFAELGDELARQVGVRLVRNRGRQIAYVGVNRVAEKQYLHHRHAEYHGKSQSIAAQLAHFLARVTAMSRDRDFMRHASAGFERYRYEHIFERCMSNARTRLLCRCC